MDAAIKAPSVWTVLFWKEFRQLWQACGAILSGMFALQIVCVISRLVSSRNAPAFEQFPVVIALISPFLVVIAAGGMLMGHERQTGTWAWSSSLPVTWQTALFVKVATTIVSVLATLVPLLSFAVIVQRFFGTVQENSWAMETYASLFAVLALALAMVVFMTTTLLFRETLAALLIGTVLVFTLEGIVFLIPAIEVDRALLEVQPPFILGEMVFAIAIFGVLMAVSYRWRWGTGQYANLSIRPASRPLAAAPAKIRLGEQPSEWKSLIRLGWNNSLVLRCILVCSPVLIFVFSFFSRQGILELAFAQVLVVVTLLGVTVFEGSQSKGRFRFLADRGIPPMRLFASQALAPITLCMVCIVFFTISGPGWSLTGQSAFDSILFLIPYLAIAATGCFLCGCFASICFEKGIIASVVSIMAVILSFFLLGISSGLQWESARINDPTPLWFTYLSVAAFACLGIPLLIWQLYGTCKNWLILDRPTLAGRFFGIVALVLLTPFIVSVSIGFLFIPKVPWQGIAPDGIAMQQSVSGPILDVNEELFPNRSSAAMDFSRSSIQIEEVYLRIVEYAAKDWGPNAVSKRLVELERLPASESQMYSPREIYPLLNEHLMETAVLAVYLLEQGREEDSLVALRGHAELQRIACELSCAQTAASRLSALTLFNQRLDTSLLESFIDKDKLKEILIPDLKDAKPELLRLAKTEAGWFRENVRGNSLPDDPTIIRNRYFYPNFWISAYVPPIRWRHERILASRLAQTLYAIRSGPDSIVDTGNDWFGIHLSSEQRIQVLRRDLRDRIYQALPSEQQTVFGSMDGSLSYGGEQIEDGTELLDVDLEVEWKSNVSERPPSPKRE